MTLLGSLLALFGLTLPPWLIEVLSWTSFAVTASCVWWLLKATWRREPDGRPSPVTWGTWGIVSMIATVAMIRGGVDWTAWLQKAGLGVGPLLVWAVARYRGIPYVTDRQDRISLVIAVFGTVAYVGTGARESAIAICTAIAVDAVGGWPTLRGAWLDPHREPVRTYVIAWCSLTVVFSIIPAPWTFTSIGALTFVWVQMLAIITTFTVARRRDARIEPAPAG